MLLANDCWKWTSSPYHNMIIMINVFFLLKLPLLPFFRNSTFVLAVTIDNVSMQHVLSSITHQPAIGGRTCALRSFFIPQSSKQFCFKFCFKLEPKRGSKIPGMGFLGEQIMCLGSCLSSLDHLGVSLTEILFKVLKN